MIRLLPQPAATTTVFKRTFVNSGTSRVRSSSQRPLVTGYKKDRQKSTMSATGTKATVASPYKMHITPENTGLLKLTQTEEVADKASTLLQEDLEKHHVFFNDEGYHNHIPHQILALYGTGATSSSIQQGYNTNNGYQLPVKPPHENVINSLFQSWDHAQPYLGKQEHYPDFLKFFQREIENAGDRWEETVLGRYLFKLKGDPAGDDMLVRLYSGFLHPLIQLMYGVEWKQPAIVAEGLAQAAVHGNDIGGFLLEAERRADETGRDEEMGDILDLFNVVKGDEKLSKAVRMSDPNKVRDGVLVRAKEEMIEIASRVRVKADEAEVERRTAEMFDACVYIASSAAVREGKVPKFDFFLIHHVNASPFFLTLNSRSWLPIETKARILEWKIRMDLIQYAARAVPTVSADRIAGYKPKKSQQSVPSDIISRLHTFQDDGHAIKLGRAALICHDLVSSLNKENKLDGVKLAINNHELWNKVFHLVVDSVEGPGPIMVRCAGLEEAWEEVPDARSDSDENHNL